MDIEDRTAFMHLLEDLSKRREKINKLKQTLAEIKEIAESCHNTSMCKECKFFNDCEDGALPLIIQKISEV